MRDSGAGPRDASSILERYGRTPDALLPVTLEDKLRERPAGNVPERPSCLFLGAYFRPNVEGLRWFAENVFPQAGIELKVVGKGMEKLRGLLPEGIEVIGSVDDLAPYITAADAMILPIFKGSGMKVKTCESIMYGKNIIGTPEAFEGYGLDPASAGGCCTSKEEFLAALRSLPGRPRFNEYTRGVYEASHTPEAALKTLESVLL